MLRSMTVHNYKAIGPAPVSLQLAPITILVGKNGTGKSSMLEALAMTAQSALADRNRLGLVLTGDKVDVPHDTESDQEIVESIYYQRDPDKSLSVGIEIDVEGLLLLDTGDSALQRHLAGIVTGANDIAGYKWSRTGSNRSTWNHEYSVNKTPLVHAYNEIEKTSVNSFIQGDYLQLHWLNDEPLRGAFRTSLDRVLPWTLFANLDPRIFKGNDKSLDEEFEALRFAGEAVLDVQLRDSFKNVAFLSALRGQHIMHRDVGPEVRFTGKYGDMTIRLLSNIQARDDARLAMLRKWATEFGLHEIEAGWAGDQLLKVTFRDAPSGTRLVLDHAASGSVNGLMLAAQLLFSPPGACLLIEEPEASMNPGFEKKLPGLFLESVRQGHQVVIATHSEVLVAAMGNAVRLGLNGMKPEEVSIFELSRDGKKGVRAERIDISDRGYLDRWVTSFSEVEQELFHEWAESLPEARDEADPGYTPDRRRRKNSRSKKSKPRGSTKK